MTYTEQYGVAVIAQDGKRKIHTDLEKQVAEAIVQNGANVANGNRYILLTRQVSRWKIA